VSLSLPLYQTLFLTAHDEHGAPLIHLPSLGLGLAGAAVLDLMLDKRLALQNTQAWALVAEPFGDLVTDTLVRTLGRDGAPYPLAFWLKAGAAGMYDQVAHVLIGEGRLTVGSRRRFGLRRQVLVPTDPVTRARIQTNLLHVFHGRLSGDPAWAALCGLVGALRLERTMDVETNTHDTLTRLRWIANTQYPDCAVVLAVMEDLLGDTAVAAYR